MKKRPIPIIVSVVVALLAIISGVVCAVVLDRKKGCTYDREVATADYLATPATCTDKATYYKSCACGKKGTETFEYGEPLGHTYGEWIVEVPATIENTGIRGHYHCSGCGDNFDSANQKIEDVTIPKVEHPHAYDREVATSEHLATPATCTAKATYYKSCACGENGTETFEYGEPLGHSFTNYVSDNNATCTADGTKTATCDHDGCGETDEVTDEGSMLGHDYGEWVTNGDGTHTKTCSHDNSHGVTEDCEDVDSDHECDICGDTISAHTYGEWIDEEPATCTEDGTKGHKDCSVCGNHFDDEDNQITDLTILASGHAYGEWIEGVPATEESTGTVAHKDCTTCGKHFDMDNVEIENIIIPELDHVCDHVLEVVAASYLKTAATCTESAVYYKSCSCGERSTTDTFTHGDPLGHDYGDWVKDEGSDTHTKTCLHDATHTVTENCSGGTATCVSTAICETCHEGYGELAEHSYGEWVKDEGSDTHTKTCLHDATHTVTENCSGGTATCVSKAICETCHEGYGELAEHIFTSYISNGDATCTADGTKTATCDNAGCEETDTVADEGSMLEHTYDREVATVDYLATHATCTAKATYYKSCTCGASGTLTFEYGELAAHSYGTLVPATPATCTSTGLSAHYHCPACDKYFNESRIEKTLDELTIAVDSTAHAYGEWVKNSGANTHTKTCSRDNSHSVTEDCADTDSDHNCNGCGATISEHTGGSATCLDEAICTICGNGYGGLAGHDYGTLVDETPATCSSTGLKAHYQCSVCNKRFDESFVEKSLVDLTIPVDSSAHTFINYVSDDNATCTANGTKTAHCENDGCAATDTVVVEGSMLGHDWVDYVSNNNNTHTKKCSRDESHTERENCIDEDGEGVRDGRCNLCGSEITSSGLEFTQLAAEPLTYSVAMGSCTDTNVVIPGTYNGGTVTTVAAEGFKSKKSITSVTLPDSIKRIEKEAFYESGLTSVTIPENVTYIGSQAFGMCKNLETVNWNVTACTTGGTPGFYIFNNSGSNIKTLNIGNNVTTIPAHAFWGIAIKSVTFPDGLKSIGDYAFNKTKVKSITIPDSVTEMGKGVFSNCENLTSVILSKELTEIKDGTFSDCKNLQSVVVFDKITKISGSCFTSDYEAVLYFKGTKAQWNRIDYTAYGNSSIVNRVKYYNETKPEADWGNYWHYNELDKPVVWKEDD